MTAFALVDGFAKVKTSWTTAYYAEFGRNRTVASRLCVTAFSVAACALHTVALEDVMGATHNKPAPYKLANGGIVIAVDQGISRRLHPKQACTERQQRKTLTARQMSYFDRSILPCGQDCSTQRIAGRQRERGIVWGLFTSKQSTTQGQLLYENYM